MAIRKEIKGKPPDWAQLLWDLSADDASTLWTNIGGSSGGGSSSGFGFSTYGSFGTDGGYAGGGGTAFFDNGGGNGTFYAQTPTQLSEVVINGTGGGSGNNWDLFQANAGAVANGVAKMHDNIYSVLGGDKTTPFQVGVEWLTGEGTRDRFFTNGDYFTEMLRKHNHISRTKQLAVTAIKKGERFGNNPYDLGGVQGVGKYLVDYSTLATGGLTGNLAVTYLGSFNLKWNLISNVDGTAVVIFNVLNSSTMQSASRPPILGYLPLWQNTVGASINKSFETGWGSKTTQTFNWTEILNTN